ncbi:MAG: DUF3471 domain-containing protein, partial [Candidatus Atribacteria bacterium]
FTNQQADAAFSAITNTIKDGYYGVTGADRISQYKDLVTRNQENAKAITDAVWRSIDEQQKDNGAVIDTGLYTGTYTDIWFGDVTISMKDWKLRFNAVKSHKLSGEMIFYKGNTFIVKWDDRTLDSDAFAVFSLDREGLPSGITMEAISPLTDFSFDFQDLDFHRKSGAN